MHLPYCFLIPDGVSPLLVQKCKRKMAEDASPKRALGESQEGRSASPKRLRVQDAAASSDAEEPVLTNEEAEQANDDALDLLSIPQDIDVSFLERCAQDSGPTD